jgi:2-phosphosulfolactate phosphatase
MNDMDIVVASLLPAAAEAAGTVVIVDVYRAFTTAAVAFARGAKKIVFVAEAADAIAAKKAGRGDFTAGEVDGRKPAGFDFGNSPYELACADIAGKTMILSTRAGVVGAASATKAERLYGCALVNAAATAQAVLAERPKLVTIVAMGWAGRTRSDEDEQCALYLRNLLQGRQPDREAVRALVLAGAESQKFGDPAQPHFHLEDRNLALNIDGIPVPVRLERRDGGVISEVT